MPNLQTAPSITSIRYKGFGPLPHLLFDRPDRLPFFHPHLQIPPTGFTLIRENDGHMPSETLLHLVIPRRVVCSILFICLGIGFEGALLALYFFAGQVTARGELGAGGGGEMNGGWGEEGLGFGLALLGLHRLGTRGG